MAAKAVVTYSEMVKNLAKAGADIKKGLTAKSAHLWHMATGISGEIGEIQEYLMFGKPITNFVEEAGDTEFYIEGLCQEFGIDTSRGRSCLPELATGLEVSVYASIAASQVLDAIKKHAVYGKPLDEDKLRDAITLLLNAMAMLYTHTNSDRALVLKANMDKLSVRYAAGTYSDSAAVKRADKAGTSEEE